MIGDLGNRTYSCIWGVSSNGKAKCNRSLMTNAYGVKSSKNTFENDFDGDPLKSVVSPSTYAFRVLPGTPGRIHTLVYIWNGSTETVVYIYMIYRYQPFNQPFFQQLAGPWSEATGKLRGELMHGPGHSHPHLWAIVGGSSHLLL